MTCVACVLRTQCTTQSKLTDIVSNLHLELEVTEKKVEPA